MTGNPAGPTDAPIGRLAAEVSVAAAGAAGGVDVLDDVEAEELEEEDGEEDVVLGDSVDATAAVSVEGAVPEVLASERSSDWKRTRAPSASRWSSNNRLACSPSAGTALPSTTSLR